MTLFSYKHLLYMTPLLWGCQMMPNSVQSPVEKLADTNWDSKNAVYEIEKASAARFYRNTQSLSHALTNYCASEQDSKAEVKQAWSTVMHSWMALQGQERGPQQALDLNWNIQFWPDKKNTLGRKMSELLGDSQVWDSQGIAEQSVTVQGVGAIEWLLYDEASDLATNSTTCQTAIAIGQTLQSHALAINEGWQSNPWLELSAQQWRSEYVSLLSNQLDYSMKKLSRPLAKIGQPKPYFAESWRAKRSMTQLKYNVQALQKLYFADGRGLDKLLRDNGSTQVADSIGQQFANVLASWPQQQSVFDLLQTKQGYRVVLNQYHKLEHLKYLLDENAAVELGIVIGFNATDGD
ncbi:imelysin family protein [Vibrio neonatus]|uniref:imelysin family protein n=1 Tax=Vibrio neonatus TaxID=278860 RepID=UPI0021C29297|nr:imelysin family protein [Vibrio neonatus]